MSEKKSCSAVVCHLIRTERLHKAIVDSRVSALGIHRNQHSVLREIERAEKTPGARPLSQKDIAEKFGISAAAVAMMMKKMEAEGYVKRVISQNDNRFNELYLDENGRDILDRTREIFREINDVIYDGLSEEELASMTACLEKIQKNLETFPESKNGAALTPGGFKKRV